MGTRRQARELAMQALFYMDMRKDASEEMLEYFCDCFCLVERFSQNWKISRMSCVDRNVMRIAVYELLYCDDIPPKVSINEAVDIGKKFGTQESGAFINGIMDSIRGALEKEGTLKKVDIPQSDAVE